MDTTYASTEASEQNLVKNENENLDLAKIQAHITPEQVRSDIVARKRRKFTKKRSTSLTRREPTPVRDLDEKPTTSDEDTPKQQPKTPERKRSRRNRSIGKPIITGTEPEPGKSLLNGNKNNISRNNSFKSPKSSNDEERKKSLSDLAQEEVKSFLSKTKKSLTAAAARGRERFRKYEKEQVKRSQSAPHQFTEEELIESFRKAQLLSAQNGRSRKFSDTSLISIEAEEIFVQKPESRRARTLEPCIRKPLRPEAEFIVRHRRKQRDYSTKIIEVLDPRTSDVVARKTIVRPSDMKLLDVFRILRFFSILDIFRAYRFYKVERKAEYRKLRVLWNKCMFELFLIMMYCGIGGIIFKFTEGSFEHYYKCGVKRVKRDFVDLLWVKSHNMREDDWKSLARNRLRVFEEELHSAHEAGMTSYSGQRSWSFLNGVVYALTVVTTIGYGHLYPTTITGRALTIVYSIIGIPLFLIALTDFGKLFTRAIKFLWSFVRRLYYTGSCRKYRKTAHVQEIFKGAQMMYDIATFRRPSISNQPTDSENPQVPPLSKPSSLTTPTVLTSESDTPTTPAISNFEIDDEFNLPISVALFILIAYIFIGALIYCMWEDWNFFASFYFVFISMSTIGFGDFVPKHPICMIVSIVYLVFGLALMSMCINVVQLKLSDTFQQASAKLGASIGFDTDEDGSLAAPENVEVAPVHTPSGGTAEDQALVVPMVKVLVNKATKAGNATSPNTLELPDPDSGVGAEKKME